MNPIISFEEDISLKPCPYFIQRSFAADSTHAFRSQFMRDRDRIMFSKSFRRLSGKTQVFTATFDDHARNRLTHTLEVAQFARTLAKVLKLDVDLAEAIALGHDVGHTPFGHSGELAINQIMNGCNSKLIKDMYEHNPNMAGFKHNLQSVRVLVDLERDFRSPKGLNLTNFTLYGIMDHTRMDWSECYKLIDKNRNAPLSNKCLFSIKSKDCNKGYKTSTEFYNIYNNFMTFKCQPDNNYDQEKQLLVKRLEGKKCWSFESNLVALCDEIAQRHHDLEDGLEAGIMTNAQVYHLMKDHFQEIIEDGNHEVDRVNLNSLKNSINSVNFKSYLSRFLFNLYLSQAHEYISEKFQKFMLDHRIHSEEDWGHTYVEITENYNDANLQNKLKSIVNYSPRFSYEDDKLHIELKSKILNSFQVQRMDSHGQYIVRKLFWAYLDNPQQLPDKTIYTLYRAYYQHAEFHKLKELNATNPDSTYIEFESKYKNGVSGEFEPGIVTLVANELRKDLQFDKNSDEFRPILLRVVCDYVSGMTDKYALEEFKKLYK